MLVGAIGVFHAGLLRTAETLVSTRDYPNTSRITAKHIAKLNKYVQTANTYFGYVDIVCLFRV